MKMPKLELCIFYFIFNHLRVSSSLFLQTGFLLCIKHKLLHWYLLVHMKEKSLYNAYYHYNISTFTQNLYTQFPWSFQSSLKEPVNQFHIATFSFPILAISLTFFQHENQGQSLWTKYSFGKFFLIPVLPFFLVLFPLLLNTSTCIEYVEVKKISAKSKCQSKSPFNTYFKFC